MKTNRTRLIALFLAAALLLLTFAGCSKEPEKMETSEPSNGPGYDDLIETDSLIIYIMEGNEVVDQRRVNQFMSYYDVEVETVYVACSGFIEYAERIINDLNAGSGPDVIWLPYLYYSDILKMAQNHSFLDLTNILAEDPEFSKDDYIDGVFEACQLFGRQYMVPFSFELPVQLSSAEKLEELDFTWDNVTSTSIFLDEIARLTPKAYETVGFKQMLDGKNRFKYMYAASGIELIDYETREVLPDEKGLRQFLEGYKTYFPYDYDGSGRVPIGGDGSGKLIKGECAFWFPPAFDHLLEEMSLMKDQSTPYSLHVIPGQNGDIISDLRNGMIAINANTKNSMNAYRFIKFLLSEDTQKDQNIIGSNIPIHKEAICRYVYEAPTMEMTHGVAVYHFEKPAFTEEEAEEILETITSVDQFTIAMPVMSDMLFESMLPFFKAEDSYISCLKELKSKLNIYLSE